MVQMECLEYYHHRSFCFISVSLLTTLFLILPLFLKVHAYWFPIYGGIVGSLCSSYVIVNYYMHPEMREPPMALLLWRAVCDLGLGIRFLLTPAFNMFLCGSPQCQIGINVDSCQQGDCAFASGMFEFLEISSEAWFLCIAIDLLNTKTNPFSNFKSLKRYYHFFAWGTGLIFSLPAFISTNWRSQISGFWVITTENQEPIDNNVFCWLQMSKNSTTFVPFLMFYIPLMMSFSFAAVVLFQCFRYLRRGVSYTFVHRLRVLFINTINLFSCLVYWLILLGVYSGVYIAVDSDMGAAKVLHKILLYLLPSKGTSTVIVWALVKSLLEDLRQVKRSMKADHRDASDAMWISASGELDVDANGALRKQVLLFAAEGIRKTAKRSKEIAFSPQEVHRVSTRRDRKYEDLPKIRIFMKHGSEDKDQGGENGFAMKSMTFYSFILLIMGFKSNMRSYLEQIYEKGKEEDAQLDNYRDSVKSSSRPDPKSFNNYSSSVRSGPGLGQIEEGSGVSTSVSSDSMSSDVLRLREQYGSVDVDVNAVESPKPSPSMVNGRTDSADSKKSQDDRLSMRLTLESNPERGFRRNTVINNSGGPETAGTSGQKGDEKSENDETNKRSSKPTSSVVGRDTHDTHSDSMTFMTAQTRSRDSSMSTLGTLGTEGNAPAGSTHMRGSIGGSGVASTHAKQSWNSASSTNRMSIVETDEIFDFKDVTEKTRGWWDYVEDACAYVVSLWRQEVDYRVEFTEHMPYHFRRVRASSSFDDDFYRSLFVEQVKDRLTQGGASGALFFYCKDEICIAKSVKESELKALLDYGKRYCDYMCTQKDSYICKIFGVYTLQIYGSKLHFFVMNNLFYNNVGHDRLEKYDIKGSWINRNASKVRYGRWQTCTHCEEKFFYSKPQRSGGPKRTNHANANISKDWGDGDGATNADAVGTVMQDEVVSPLSRAGGGFEAMRTPSLDARNSTVEMRSINDKKSRSIDDKDTDSLAREGLGILNDLEAGRPPRYSKESVASTSTKSALDSAQNSRCRYTVDGMHKPEVTFKDNDLREKILLDASAAAKLRRTLKKDAAFLCSLRVMDYSLVIGVHSTLYDVKDTEEDGADDFNSSQKRSSVGHELASNIQHFQKPSKVSQVRGPDCYYMGILDFQQEWSFGKRGEQVLKIIKYGWKDRFGISAVEPDHYYSRFCDKIDELFLTDAELLLHDADGTMEEAALADLEAEGQGEEDDVGPLPPNTLAAVFPASAADAAEDEEDGRGYESMSSPSTPSSVVEGVGVTPPTRRPTTDDVPPPSGTGTHEASDSPGPLSSLPSTSSKGVPTGPVNISGRRQSMKKRNSVLSPRPTSQKVSTSAAAAAAAAAAALQKE